MSADAGEAESSRILELISAVANGDAAREDVASALRDEGVDSLDVLVEVLAMAGRERDEPGAGSEFLDLQRVFTVDPPPRRPEDAHRVPGKPFLLRGTLYDPTDVERFNGRDLHFLSAPGRDHLLAIDERAVMNNWWQLSFVSSFMISSDQPVKAVTAEGSGTVSIADFGGGGGTPSGEIVVGIPTGSTGPEGFSGLSGPPPIEPHTNFYEHPANGGSRITLSPNRGFVDLTEVGYGFLGSGNWNDRISSIELVATQVAAIYEHVGYLGSSFSTLQNERELGGWNDQASSCGTW